MSKTTRPDTPGRPEEFFARGFQFYIDGRHAITCRQDEAAGYLFHIAVELMLKASLLRETFERSDACLREAREALIAREGLDAELDPKVADACLAPYRDRVDELKDEYVHSLDRLWRDARSALGKPALKKFDPAITKISQWRDFRYPAFVHGRPKVTTTSRVKGAVVSHRGRGHVNRADINRGEVDELVTALIETLGFSANWVRLRAGDEAGLATYREGNRHVIKGL